MGGTMIGTGYGGLGPCRKLEQRTRLLMEDFHGTKVAS